MDKSQYSPNLNPIKHVKDSVGRYMAECNPVFHSKKDLVMGIK